MIGAAIGSVVGGIAQASAAKKGADAQVKAAEKANETQRYIYDRNVELSEPWRQTGQNALAVLANEMGLPTDGLIGGASAPQNALSITETQTQTGYAPRYWHDRRQEWIGGPTYDTQFTVGDQSFGSRDAAQNYIDQQPAPAPTEQAEIPGFQQSPGYQFRMDQGNKALERMAAARGLSLSGRTLQEAADFNQGLASQEYGNWWNRVSGLAGSGQAAVQNTQALGANYANQVGQNYMAAGRARASGYQGMGNALSGTINSLGGIYGSAMSGAYGPNPGFGIQPSPVGLNAWGWS